MQMAKLPSPGIRFSFTPEGLGMREGGSHEKKKKESLITIVIYIFNVLNKVDYSHILVEYLHFLHLSVYSCGTF